jgi:5-methyltetrahydrofolate--homocysteine methyltransferase
MRLSGLEPFTIDDESLFVNVGERTNVTGSKAFARMILNEQYDEALAVARQQVENGAQIIDINMDEAMLDSGRHDALPEPDRLRAGHRARADHDRLVQVGGDRSRPEVRAGQGHRQLHLDEGRRGEFLRQAKLCRRYGAAVIVMAFDEVGQADTFARKIEICERAYACWWTSWTSRPKTSSSTPTSSRSPPASRNTTTTRSTSSKPPAGSREPALRQVSGGVSNVSFSFRGNDPVREAIHTVFLYHAIKAGMTMGIVNAGMLGVYDDLRPNCASAWKTWC